LRSNNEIWRIGLIFKDNINSKVSLIRANCDIENLCNKPNYSFIPDDSFIPDLNETRKLYLLVPSIFSSPILNNKYSVSEISCDFVSRLLNKNLNERLGNKKNNEYIKNEPFFSIIDWNILENGQLEPPILIQN